MVSRISEPSTAIIWFGWELPSFKLRNINSMASDLMVLPRCYTTLTATWSAEMEGSGTGHMEKGPIVMHSIARGTGRGFVFLRWDAICRETKALRIDEWLSYLAICSSQASLKAIHLAPVFFSRGIGKGYTGGYHEYFGPDADIDSHIYLMLANDLIHSVVPLVHFWGM